MKLLETMELDKEERKTTVSKLYEWAREIGVSDDDKFIEAMNNLEVYFSSLNREEANWEKRQGGGARRRRHHSRKHRKTRKHRSRRHRKSRRRA